MKNEYASQAALGTKINYKNLKVWKVGTNCAFSFLFDLDTRDGDMCVCAWRERERWIAVEAY